MTTHATVDPNTLIRTYVHHHWVASRGGVEMFARAASGMPDPQVRAELAELAEQVRQDRTVLREIADRVGVGQASLSQQLMVAGERLGRLKPNGSLTRRTALTDLVELEALVMAVRSKRQGWLAMLGFAERDDRFDEAELRRLIDRADEQVDRLDALHARAAAALPRYPGAMSS
ncbi:hypothetical protein G9U51_02520 [Calidifontibacter sp. DB0510]|uniref:Uncharacterized protein n=1 Tax=Metallococcus carri TaxID=1656884 RepID=A0A967AZV0_9MICO|nr:hypothetical protein [Metallococcus carri]NHN54655.1 hypothetical protein [Metallococcus carri]NOP37000.1 hypothetical protein [Calidifontibacter sp. DB2511S]